MNFAEPVKEVAAPSFTEVPKEKGTRHKFFTIIGVVLCVLLIPIVIINCTLIVKQALNDDEVPSVGGIFPMIVLTDSMAGTFNAGSLIVCGQVSAEDVQAGDIICFFDPAGNGTTTTTHRVQEVKNNGGDISFVTKGDANNTVDSKEVPAKNLVGRYIFHIEGLGNVAMFMQTTPGLIIFAVLPILVLVAYDVVRRRAWDKRKGSETDALMAELTELRAQRDAQASGQGGVAQTMHQSYPSPASPQQFSEIPQAQAPWMPQQTRMPSVPQRPAYSPQTAQVSGGWSGWQPSNTSVSAQQQVAGMPQQRQVQMPQVAAGAQHASQQQAVQMPQAWGSSQPSQTSPQWDPSSAQSVPTTKNPREAQRAGRWQP